jgi:cysteinyl-tRNA synthetase
LSTSAGLAELFRFSLSLAPGMTLDEEDFEQLLSGLDAMLGLGFAGRPDISDHELSIINERQDARNVKDYAKSDTLRKKLQKLNLDVDDTPNGPRWRRTTA